MADTTASAHRSRSLYLLASLVVLILVSPFFEGTHIGHFAVDALYSFVLLAAVYAVSDNRRIQIIALALAILAILLMWSNTADPSTPGRVTGLLLFVALNTATIGLGLRRIVLAPAVTIGILCDGIALYLLIGVTWALIYIVMDTIDPGAFEILSPTIEKGWSEFLYFSFATLTTLGYGDISPDTPFVRTWAVMEAVTGVLYIAVMVARLVSLYRS